MATKDRFWECQIEHIYTQSACISVAKLAKLTYLKFFKTVLYIVMVYRRLRTYVITAASLSIWLTRTKTKQKDPPIKEGLNENLAPCYFPRGEPQVL